MSMTNDPELVTFELVDDQFVIVGFGKKANTRNVWGALRAGLSKIDRERTNVIVVVTDVQLVSQTEMVKIVVLAAGSVGWAERDFQPKSVFVGNALLDQYVENLRVCDSLPKAFKLARSQVST